ncbi:MAG: radical SAM protein [Myxococcota bacterium]|jgi:MoaA/NifB/PqqE/SkfB family radical SAM enzyme
MLGTYLREAPKMARYSASFMRRKLVHTNLQLLYECNMRCRICDFWHDSRRSRPALTLEQVNLISEKLNRIGPQIVSIGGGEPLLHPEIVPVVRTLARHHFPVMICNGWYMTEEIARALFAAGMYEISVSVDYADPARHDSQRGVEGAHLRAIEALRILNANRTKPHQRVHMISVIMDDNLDEVEPLLRICRKLGITYLVTLYSDCRGEKESRKIPADVSRRLLQLRKKYREFVVLRGYIERFSDAVRSGGIGPCRAGRNLCNIDSTGNVSLCIDRVEDSVGNMLTDDPLEIERRLNARHDTNRCTGCWTSCRGSIETLMYGKDRIGNFTDYLNMTRPVSLGR